MTGLVSGEEAERVEKEISVEEARKRLLDEQAKRIKECREELGRVLGKYGCALEAVTVVRNGQVQQFVEVAPAKEG